jgi:predicted nucleotidyltransferase
MAQSKDLNSVKLELGEFYKKIRTLYPVRKMLLYGSYAKGCARADSDIDVAVVVDLPDNADKIVVTANLLRQARSIDVDIEPFCVLLNEYKHHEPASILSEIIKTSIEL